MAPQVPNSSLASNDEDMLPIPQNNAKLYVCISTLFSDIPIELMMFLMRSTSTCNSQKDIRDKGKVVGCKIDLRKWYFVLLEKIYCLGVSDHITTARGGIMRSLIYHFMVS